ncbi:PREDICTED: uncharacterized protein C7orf50 homolog [Pseudopodoces humilis]|uniref:uncharacterized protein C7orf50 homolog n=1 Tax=Pseudopodoces humilis TaxID=181119 RepID=UPI0006B7F1C0|nr:PREDICTED: uncharacterized protein C7orf50 homolog [Pseudopodoces humilis]
MLAEEEMWININTLIASRICGLKGIKSVSREPRLRVSAALTALTTACCDRQHRPSLQCGPEPPGPGDPVRPWGAPRQAKGRGRRRSSARKDDVITAARSRRNARSTRVPDQHFRMPKMIVEKKEKKAEKRKKLKQHVAQKDQLELETKPAKKKKLQATKEEEELIAEEELTPEEKRKLERKLKKERKKKEKQLMREAGIPIKKVQPKKPSGSERALAYLTSWSKNPEKWKFQKTRQTWLLLHMYDKEKVPDKYFPILLDYLQGLQGGARDKTVQKAEAFMKEFDGSDGEDPNLLEKCERIRQVLQLLS